MSIILGVILVIILKCLKVQEFQYNCQGIEQLVKEYPFKIPVWILVLLIISIIHVVFVILLYVLLIAILVSCANEFISTENSVMITRRLALKDLNIINKLIKILNKKVF